MPDQHVVRERRRGELPLQVLDRDRLAVHPVARLEPARLVVEKAGAENPHVAAAQQAPPLHVLSLVALRHRHLRDAGLVAERRTDVKAVLVVPVHPPCAIGRVLRRDRPPVRGHDGHPRRMREVDLAVQVLKADRQLVQALVPDGREIQLEPPRLAALQRVAEGVVGTDHLARAVAPRRQRDGRALDGLVGREDVAGRRGERTKRERQPLKRGGLHLEVVQPLRVRAIDPDARIAAVRRRKREAEDVARRVFVCVPLRQHLLSARQDAVAGLGVGAERRAHVAPAAVPPRPEVDGRRRIGLLALVQPLVHDGQGVGIGLEAVPDAREDVRLGRRAQHEFDACRPVERNLDDGVRHDLRPADGQKSKENCHGRYFTLFRRNAKVPEAVIKSCSRTAPLIMV